VDLTSNESQAGAEQPVMALLVERKKKKKKKKGKKKKTGLLVRVIGKIVLGSAAALSQVGEAMTDAAGKYQRKHEKSRNKRKDGWKKDLGRNLASATSELITGSAKAPGKFAKALWKKSKKRKKTEKQADHDVIVQSAVPVVPAGSSSEA
jgi:hypothetical protein